MFEMLTGAFIFAAGYIMCYFLKLSEKKDKQDHPVAEGEVRRIKPSLRNPLRTYEVCYERYKGKDTNLYQPVKPVRKTNNANEVDVDAL